MKVFHIACFTVKAVGTNPIMLPNALRTYAVGVIYFFTLLF